MQLMPATARGLGVTDVFNAEQNINGGAKYLSQLYKKYNGDLNLTLAGYNAGPGNVAKYGGVPPFKETENYIIKVGKALKEDGLVGEVAPKIQNISMVQDNILDSKEISYWLESLKYQFFKELNDKNPLIYN